MNKTLLISSLATAIALSSANAAVVWTGTAADNDFFNDANWDFTAAVNGTTAVDPETLINEDLQVTAAGSLTGAGAAFGGLVLGDGFSLNLDNTDLTMSGSAGIAGNNDVGDVASTVNLTNGSALSLQFASIVVAFNIDGTSSLQIRGGGDGINSQTEPTTVSLVTGGRLILTNRAEFDEQVTANSGAGTITVNGTAVTVDNMDTLFTFVGGEGTAIPEPSSTALLGLAGLGFILRRRK